MHGVIEITAQSLQISLQLLDFHRLELQIRQSAHTFRPQCRIFRRKTQEVSITLDRLVMTSSDSRIRIDLNRLMFEILYRGRVIRVTSAITVERPRRPQRSHRYDRHDHCAAHGPISAN